MDLSRGVIRLEQTKSGKRCEVPMRQGQGPREGWDFRTCTIRTAVENAVVEAKLEDFRLHNTRHRFASWFVMWRGSLAALK